MQPELFLEPQRRERFKARPQATTKLAALQLVGKDLSLGREADEVLVF